MLARAAAVCVCALFAANARAAIEIHALTEVIEGHQVGGVTADMVGDLYVADFGDTVWKITMEGERRVFATGLYGASGNAIDGQGNLYTVNFRDNRMLKIDRQGTVSLFASVSDQGLGHVCFSTDRFYVTAFRANEIFQVTLDGKAKRILGTGERGLVDGPDGTARLTFPNGIACHPWGERLYINEYVGETDSSVPRRAIVRQIIL
jgi:sugar lactone lactonase YvrE